MKAIVKKENVVWINPVQQKFQKSLHLQDTASKLRHGAGDSAFQDVA